MLIVDLNVTQNNVRYPLSFYPPGFIAIIGQKTSILGGFVTDPRLQTPLPSPGAHRLQTVHPSPWAYWPLGWVGMSATLGLEQPSPETWSLLLITYFFLEESVLYQFNFISAWNINAQSRLSIKSIIQM